MLRRSGRRTHRGGLTRAPRKCSTGPRVRGGASAENLSHVRSSRACRRATGSARQAGRHIRMANVTVIGAQWGDEGKGKLVDWLCNRADVVVRFQGGHNAGHTLVVGDKTYKLSLLPSGLVQGKLSIIGNGVVVDPWALLKEIDTLRGQGVTVTPDVLAVAENAALILPFHSKLDLLREEARS